ncbi:MAG: PTS glucose transporter subunit IIA [Lachnospiraceae bacterium]
MFSFLSSSKTITAPMTGRLIPIEKVNDSVFSSKMLGNGFGIIQTSPIVVAPVAGKILQVFDTKHAVCIESNDGIEILIHLGIDTVSLEGNGFTTFVNPGDLVNPGDKLVEMDIDYIKSQGLDPTCIVVFTDESVFKTCEIQPGEVIAAKTIAVKYKLN